MGVRDIAHPIENPGDRVQYLHGRVVLGASGAVSSQVCQRFSVARTSAGVYTITLNAKDAWTGLFGVDCTVLGAGATAAAKGSVWKLDSTTLPGEGKVIVGRFEIPATGGAAGTAADPPDSAILHFTIKLKASYR